MILEHSELSALPFGKKTLLPYDYSSGQPRLSLVAELVLKTIKQREKVATDTAASPEVIALRLLDYLSSKQGYVRRNGKTFRNEEVYRRMLDEFSKAISNKKPIKLSSICMCTALCNPDLVGPSPYPHMASYLGFENLHKILKGAKEIYAPGFTVVLGYEGNLFKPMFFHNDMVIDSTLQILQELNNIAFSVVNPNETINPVTFMDAETMVEQAFGSKSIFDELVAAKLDEAYPTIKEWLVWYEKSTSSKYFISSHHKKEFTEYIAKWRYAVRALKVKGGRFKGGFTQFEPDTIPFTMSGRRNDVIGLQLIPENPYMPHHRAIAYNSKENKWRMRAYVDIQNDTKAYVPRLVGEYSHPFYYEQI